MSIADYKLFTPLKLGEGFELKNRIVHAPLTRGRANRDRTPSELIQLYYEQRVGAGLIVAEGTAISEQGYGWYRVPGLYNQEQLAAWKKVVDRVHKKDGKIVLQLWHAGRQSHSSFNAKKEVVAPSAIRVVDGSTRDVDAIKSSFEMPRALDIDEIPTIVEHFRRSAALALDAGFDGVEIHGGNGYLVDTFLQSSTNKRTDKYGGSFENRARFLLEVVEAVKMVYPSDRIGVRLSPNGAYGSMGAEDNYEMFNYAMDQLSKHGLAYLSLIDAYGFTGFHEKCRPTTAFDAKKMFKGVVMANNDYMRDSAEGALRSGAADLVAFGRPYISNPDLAERFLNDCPLNPPASYETYFSQRTLDKDPGDGYVDFPAYEPKP
ncbi:hypothetical protein Poli38472_010455 [Pythium oligandrum]|uniref:NADH:flavin oxidoreductase/NADH oxidase N-terminal domain-containing protein n=1 Tax=Pythium oligandrum TaxID=41045 RepID=A0A8K1FE70_PYTOL|nr:hypothetical protein Poli38472_010455 [Pythium oligandrum]|eukprot:TMW55573.1 hypothetical protein Poli38472_010455 [Pythium oligandrum]